ncbi:MAG TPA: hypothetical protein VMU54_05265 [Planctomycetota bacterium]|nr:hypothetical protein [Planctomycetota bacterium]
MRKLAWVVLAALSYSSMPGCGGVSKQELDTVKAELLAHDELVKSQLKTELTGVDQKYVTVQQLQLKVEKQLEDLAKLQKDLTELAKSVDDRANVATGNALKSLQFEEKLMSERLAELRSLIEELKKK